MTLAVIGCAGGGTRPTTPAEERAVLPHLSAEDREFLVSPLEGYPRTLAPDVADRLLEAHLALVTRADAEAARQTAAELLAADREMAGARLLAAQADFAAGEVEPAYEAARQVLAGDPGYVAAALLAGRAAERLGELPEAYAAYLGVAELNSLAAGRARELEDRAVEIVANRARDSLRRGNLEEARERLSRLSAWAPESPVTLSLVADLAHAEGNRQTELDAVRRLAERRAEDRELLERWLDLELEVGDARQGLELAERLSRRYPQDPALAEKLAFAKFRFRLGVLPERVQELAGRVELERGDQALLLFWLFPQVRYGEAGRPRIATDILDDPRREEIARVVNLGLMDVDESLHRFYPEGPLERRSLLRSLLRLLAQAEPPADCARNLAPRPSQEAICAAAERCRLIPSVADCLPEATVSGREALGYVQRALELSGSR